jgi:hypothetical protein
MGTKIKLDLTELRVDSFEAQAEEKTDRGTVRGYWSFGCDTMYDATCHGYGTCGIYPCKLVP